MMNTVLFIKCVTMPCILLNFVTIISIFVLGDIIKQICKASYLLFVSCRPQGASYKGR